ncbi:protein of unknown function [Salegentibacter holothuriorum]|uniref:DUF4286 domain-containing protein n=1 Tax=Salegentibacter holothuriorum TaxID=241145 RepID=A0A1T5BN28_9FLAO|nr:DUF4286 family protein [Salegentibacter holothuriorum]SKB48676.1 protein of unknown function [Salegentibacter holothuriorum]
MYIYNVTINVEEAIHDDWVKWMKEEHIPEMLDTGKFKKALMSRVMVTEAMGGITYSVQYTAENKAELDKYYKEDADSMRKKTKIFEGKFVAFRTEMQVISEQ